MNDPNVYCYIQEGGSSRELYFHSFDTQAGAEGGKESAEESGAYSCSPIFTVPRPLADTKGFADSVQVVLDHVGKMGFES